MTQIILKTKKSAAPVELIDLTRSPRELIKAINTGMLVIGPGRMGRTGQWATFDRSLNAVVVIDGPPKIALWPRHYDVLYALVDGCQADQMAVRLGICRRTVYFHIAELKKRLNAQSRYQMIALALELGLVCSGTEQINPQAAKIIPLADDSVLGTEYNPLILKKFA